MANYRMVNTKFWTDSYVAGLSPLQKLLFLYLITNPLANIAGAYEVTLRQIAFDLGLDEITANQLLTKLVGDKKISYKDNWILIHNFIKHQANNPNIEQGIERILDNIPDWIKDSLRKPSDRLRVTELNRTELNLTEPSGDPTPKLIAIEFFKNQEPIIQELLAKGLPEEAIRREVKAFVNFWTEYNSTGKKQKWQLRETFEVKRRLATWFGRVNQFNKKEGRTRKIWQ